MPAVTTAHITHFPSLGRARTTIAASITISPPHSPITAVVTTVAHSSYFMEQHSRWTEEEAALFERCDLIMAVHALSRNKSNQNHHSKVRALVQALRTDHRRLHVRGADSCSVILP